MNPCSSLLVSLTEEKPKKTKQRKRDLKVTTKDVEQGKEAIKPMLFGVALLSLFMIFFAFDIGGETLFERLSSMFTSYSVPQ